MAIMVNPDVHAGLVAVAEAGRTSPYNRPMAARAARAMGFEATARYIEQTTVDEWVAGLEAGFEPHTLVREAD